MVMPILAMDAASALGVVSGKLHDSDGRQRKMKELESSLQSSD